MARLWVVLCIAISSLLTGCAGSSPVKTIESYYTCANRSVHGDAWGGKCYLPLFSDEYIRVYGSPGQFVEFKDKFDEFYGNNFDSWTVKNSLVTESRAEITMSESITKTGANLTHTPEKQDQTYFLRRINDQWLIDNIGSPPASWTTKDNK